MIQLRAESWAESESQSLSLAGSGWQLATAKSRLIAGKRPRQTVTVIGTPGPHRASGAAPAQPLTHWPRPRRAVARAATWRPPKQLCLRVSVN